MTQFADRFREHAVHAEIRALDESVQGASLELTEDIRDGYDRFIRVFGFVKAQLDRVDPELASAQLLNQLQKNVHSLKDQHEAFKQNHDVNTLNNQADALLNVLHLLPPTPDGAPDYSDALEDLRRRANEVIDHLRDQQSELAEQMQGQSSRLGELHDSIVAQETRLESQKGRIDDLVTNQQAKFNEEQQQRISQFTEAQAERAARFDDDIDDREEQFTQLLKAKGGAADSHLQQLEEHLKRAKGIVGLIGNTGMTGHYQKVANREWRAAEIFRGLAILFFIFLIVGVGWVVMEIKSDDFSWQIALFRVGVALAFLAPAGYCARESTRHRQVENRNRRIELELASITPYLEKLSEEKAQEIIEQLAVRYFGNDESDRGREDDSPTKIYPSELLGIVERIEKLVRH